MKSNFYTFMGAFICSLFLFVSCSDVAEEVISLQRLAAVNDGSAEEPKIQLIDSAETFTLLLNDSLSTVNTNIPIKIIEDYGYLITSNNDILKFELDQLKKNAEIKTTFVSKIPSVQSKGIIDFFIQGDRIWVFTDKGKKTIVAIDLLTGKANTLLSENTYYWTSYPFLGAQANKIDDHTFCLPAVKLPGDTIMPLFSTFKLKNDKLVHESNHGVYSKGFTDGWSPFSINPIYSNLINRGFWITTSTGQSVIHYTLKNNKLIQDQSVCFPVSSVKNFIKKLSIELQRDELYVNKISITESYNLRVLNDQKHVLKFVKEKQAFLNEETQMKHILNDAPWFIDCFELESKNVKRFKFPANSHYYTYTFLLNESLIVARQGGDPGTVKFNLIKL